MKDLTQKSGIGYLAFVLLLVCGLATALMAAVSILTEAPIEKARNEKVQEGLKVVLPAFDSMDTPVKVKSKDGPDVTIYPVRKADKIVGYGVAADSMNGYGGRISGLVGFRADGTLEACIITNHNETPGIGTKVVNRVRVKTITDLVTGKKMDSGLPPNKVLDSYKGKSIYAGKKWKRSTLYFQTGATVSSNAVRDLSWRAAETLKNYLSPEDKVKGAK